MFAVGVLRRRRRFEVVRCKKIDQFHLFDPGDGRTLVWWDLK